MPVTQRLNIAGRRRPRRLLERLEPRELLSISHLFDGPLANQSYLPGERFAEIRSERGADEFRSPTAGYFAIHDAATAPIERTPDRALHDYREQRQQRLDMTDGRGFRDGFARDASPLAGTVVREIRVQVIPLQVVPLQVSGSVLPVAGDLFGWPPLQVSFINAFTARDARPEVTLLVLHGRGDGWEGSLRGESSHSASRSFEPADRVFADARFSGARTETPQGESVLARASSVGDTVASAYEQQTRFEQATSNASQAQSGWQPSSVAGIPPVERAAGVRAPEGAYGLAWGNISSNKGPSQNGGASAVEAREGGLIPLERREWTPRKDAVSGRSILDLELGGWSGDGAGPDRQTVPLPLGRGANDGPAMADRQSPTQSNTESQSSEANAELQNAQDDVPPTSGGGRTARHEAREGGLVDLMPDHTARNRMPGPQRADASEAVDARAEVQLADASGLSVDANSGLFRALEITGPSGEGWLSSVASELAQRQRLRNTIGMAPSTEGMFAESGGRGETSRAADYLRYAPWVLPLVVFAAGASAARRQRSKTNRPAGRRPIEAYWCDRFFASLAEAE